MRILNPQNNRGPTLPPHYAIFGRTKGGIFESCPRIPKLQIWLRRCWGRCLKVTLQTRAAEWNVKRAQTVSEDPIGVSGNLNKKLTTNASWCWSVCFLDFFGGGLSFNLSVAYSLSVKFVHKNPWLTVNEYIVMLSSVDPAGAKKGFPCLILCSCQLRGSWTYIERKMSAKYVLYFNKGSCFLGLIQSFSFRVAEIKLYR